MSKDTRAIGLATIVHRLMLAPHEGVYAQEICDEFGISMRTFRAWKLDLERHFVPFFDDEGRTRLRLSGEKDARRLYLEPEYVTSHITADWRAIAATIAARQTYMYLDRTLLGDAMSKASHMLIESVGASELAQRATSDVERKLVSADRSRVDYSRHGSVIARCLRAVMFMSVIELGGVGCARSEARLTEPYSIVLYQGELYLIVRYLDDEAPTSIPFSDITTVSVTNATFNYPAPGQYAPADLFDGSFGPCDMSRAPARLLIEFDADKPIAEQLRAQELHPSQEFGELSGGRLRLEMRVRSIERALSWARGLGDEVKIIEPH